MQDLCWLHLLIQHRTSLIFPPQQKQINSSFQILQIVMTVATWDYR